MYGGQYFGQAYLAQGYPERSIIFDNASSSGFESSLGTYSWTHVSGLSARGLLVNVSLFATGTVSSITYNAVGLTFVRADTQGVYRNEWWQLKAPAYGSHSVVVTLSASLTSIASAASYGNTDQNTLVDADAGTAGIGGTPALSLTPTSSYGWIISGISTINTSMSPASSQTQRANNTGALGTGAIADKGPIDPLVSTPVNWSAVGVTDSWTLGALALNPYEDLGAFIVGFTAGLSFSGAQTKQTIYPVTGSLSFTGNLSKIPARALSGVLSFSGNLIKKIVRGLTASLSFMGSTTKLVGKLQTATLSFAGVISRQVLYILTGTLSFTGALTRQFSRALTGALSFTGNLSKTAIKVLSAALSFAGSISKLISHRLTATLSFSGNLARIVSRNLAGALSFVGNLAIVYVPGLGAAAQFLRTLMGMGK